MLHRCARRTLTGCLVFGCTILSAGCLSTSQIGSALGRHQKPATNPDVVAKTDDSLPPRQSKTIVTKGMELEWDIRTPVNDPSVVKTGKASVGPDGTIVLGPYGPVHVGGLSLDQASLAMERHVSEYVKQAKVNVSAMSLDAGPAPSAATPTSNDLTWKSAKVNPAASGGFFTRQAPKSAAAESNVIASAGTPAASATQNKGGFFTRMTGKPAPHAEAVNVASAGAPAPKREQPTIHPTNFQMPPLTDDSKDPKAGKTVKAKEDDSGPFKVRVPAAATGAADTTQPFAVYPQYAMHPIANGHGGHGSPNELNRVTLPPYVIGVTDVLQIESMRGLLEQPVRGPHLVRPDGTVGMGIYGSVLVAGLNFDQAKHEIARLIHSRLDKEIKFEDVYAKVSVDALAYNAKVYYVVFEGVGLDDQVYQFPYTGNETVLDALAKLNGLPVQGSKKRVYVARRNLGPGQILPVDWCGVARRGDATTNHMLLPGDRVVVEADRLIRADRTIAKILSPIERILGATLLGAETVNSMSGRRNIGNTR